MMKFWQKENEIRVDWRQASMGFTLIELLVVISIIGVLASLTVGIATVASTKKKLTATQGKLSELELAIESYKADLGGYPPDAYSAGNIVNTVTNQLFYELGGTVYRNNRFVANTGGDPLGRQVCRSFFGTDGIQNTARDETKVQSFLEISGSDYKPLTGNNLANVNLLVAPTTWPARPLEGVDSRGRALEDYRPVKSDRLDQRQLNPIQYRSTGQNRFNTSSFDLWVDVPIRNKIYRVNNWTKDNMKVISRADK